jgi:methionyl-tRNA formyltransferase
MGTSAFAVPTLQRLFEDGCTITGVITQPDKPSGRGQAIHLSPVKTKALELQLPVYQPPTIKDDTARSLFEALAPEIIVVVAYGKIIPDWLIQFPKYGAVNLHGSLLPKYRGAAPLHWAIANGETTTGVCTMQIDKGLDTGPVLLCDQTPIGPEEHVETLSTRLALMGSDLMARTLTGIVSGDLKPQPQDDAAATTAPILTRQHGFIDWRRPASAIHNQIRAFSRQPGALTRFRGTTCKILESRIGGAAEAGSEAATILASRRSLGVCCGDSAILELITVQVQNRKPVSGFEFANGARIQPGEKFDVVMDN